MPGSKTIKDHEVLMGQMADRLAVDLDEAELRGDLPPETRRDMVLSCTSCTSPDACRAWLERHDEADEAPPYCRNADALTSLRGQ